MNRSIKGIIAGIGATLIMSALILLKTEMQILPRIDAVQVFTHISHNYFDTAVNSAYGWMWFFAIAGVLWGALFGGLEKHWPGRTDLTKGFWFGFCAWLVTMIIFAPLGGFGLFASGYSMQAPWIALFGHLIYGGLLGLFYAWVNNEKPLDIKEHHIRPSS